MKAKVVMSVWLSTVCIVVGLHAQVLAGEGTDMTLEFLNAIGKGLDNGAKMNECVGGNAANWARCNAESQQRMNKYMEGVNRRVDEMTDRKLEEIAVDICRDEEDERAFERCVRKEMREMRRR